MDYYKTGAQVGPHMQHEEAFDIGLLDYRLTGLQPEDLVEIQSDDTPIDQQKYKNRFMGCSGISSAQTRQRQ
jgi:hypothetical protein